MLLSVDVLIQQYSKDPTLIIILHTPESQVSSGLLLSDDHNTKAKQHTYQTFQMLKCFLSLSLSLSPQNPPSGIRVYGMLCAQSNRLSRNKSPSTGGGGPDARKFPSYHPSHDAMPKTTISGLATYFQNCEEHSSLCHSFR